ncbi:acyltransferase family protein [Algicella marina]|uniref:Acyltransferase family protein n=1 Tax=Algicella marina TaxID=2683284 RepID=A0A6P1SW64_9RHOB|nr:acyltransferase [Algicella marina]QHQ33731.1 acyltransferase family protein [Algicella marina]
MSEISERYETGDTTSLKSRVTWADCAKGFGIVLVVFGHAWRGLYEKGVIPPLLFEAVDSRIYAFHMPLFFMLSGLFFAHGLARARGIPFLRSRALRLLWPLVLWTYLFLAFKVLAGSLSNTPVGLGAFLESPIPGRFHFWFLWALFLIQVALLPAKPLFANQGNWLPVSLALLTGSLALLLIPLPPAAFAWIGLALYHLPFFLLGVVIGRFQGRMQVSAVGAILAVGLFAALLAIAPQVTGLYNTVFLAAALSIASVAVFVWFGNGPGSGILAYLGTASMAIFLAHTIFSAGLREVLFKLGVTNLPVHLVLGTGIGLIAPIILYEIARRFRLTKLAGF